MEQTSISVAPAAPKAAGGRAGAAPVKMSTEQLKTLLRASLGADEDPADISQYRGAPVILVEEVEAPGSNRRCDLLHIGLWQSRGAGTITVYELKVSRADWLKEVDDPAKAEAWWPYCHEFWIVAPPGVVRPDEVPTGWGLMEPPTGRARSKRFKTVVKAARRSAKLTPALLASIIARADNMRRKQIGRLNERHRNDTRRAVEEARRDRGRAEMSGEDRERLAALGLLEEALGIPLDEYVWRDGVPVTKATPAEVGAALRDYVHDHIAVSRQRDELLRAVARIDPALNQLRDVLAPLATEAEAKGRRRG